MSSIAKADLELVFGGVGQTIGDATTSVAYNSCLKARKREVGPVDELFHPGKREAHQKALCSPLLRDRK